jgi:isocitrate dehydrogenase kinase/phosphatase
MLQVIIPGVEYYDEESETFIETKSQALSLEHSLVSLAKWESKWKKPFFSDTQKSREESSDYIRCMTTTQNVSPEVYDNIPGEIIKQVDQYINDPMTATWFNERQQRKHSREVVTAEIIYYQMVALNIPFECQKWHLNRLMTLIRVCSLKNEPENKMSKRQVLENNRALNQARRQKMGTKG